MVLRGLLALLLFQFSGSLLGAALLPALPGPVLGMLLATLWLALPGAGGEPLRQGAQALLGYLPLLLVPPAVGIMVQWPLIVAELPAIATALGLSLLVGIPLTGWLLQRLAGSRGASR